MFTGSFTKCPYVLRKLFFSSLSTVDNENILLTAMPGLPHASSEKTNKQTWFYIGILPGSIEEIDDSETTAA